MSSKKPLTTNYKVYSVATYLRCGGVVNNQIRKGLLLSLSVKKKLKSVKIWHDHGHESVPHFLALPVVCILNGVSSSAGRMHRKQRYSPTKTKLKSVVRNYRDKEINIDNWVVCALHYADCWVLFLCSDWPFRPVTPTSVCSITAKITRRTSLPFSRNADSWMTSDFFTNLCCAVDRSLLWDNLLVFLFDFDSYDVAACRYRCLGKT